MSPKVRRLSGPSSMVGKVVYGMAASTSPWCSTTATVASRGRALPSALRERLDPAAGGGGQRVGAGRSPRAPAVQLDGRLVLQRGVDDAPLLLDAVGPAEAPVVA